MIGVGGGQAAGPRGLIQEMGGHEKATIQGHVLRRLFAFVVPYWKRLVLALVLMLVTTGSGLLVPYFTRAIIDVNIAQLDTAGLGRNVVLLGLALLLTYGAASGQSFLLSVLGQRVLFDLRAKLFAHLQQLSVAYHDRHIVGVTVSRVMNDVVVINNLLSEGIVTLVGDTVLLGGIVGIMLVMEARLALITFAVIPIMVLATVLFSRRARVAFRETRESVATLVGSLAENIGGMRVIQSYAQEEKSQRQFQRSNQENREAHVRAVSLSFVFMPTMDFLGVLATAIVLVAGGLMAIRGSVTIGVIVAFMSYVGRFFLPIREISQLFTTLQSASAGGERVLELLDTVPAVVDADDAIAAGPLKGRVDFVDVGFSYLHNVEVLKGVSLSARPGETIAIVGPTGAGKSTITNLLCRFYEASSGDLLIDGRNIREYTAASLHKQMGYVSQDPILFPGTIAENIRYGKPEATQSEVEAAARASEAHPFISNLSNGYETAIYEGGVNLSVGQRQLLSIARAMLVDPRLLIMDEATSSVDTVTESLIQRALDQLLRDRTAFVIAHRLTTVQNADRIYVIDHGEIVEQGTHRELMSGATRYRGLYEKQFVDEAGEA